MNSRQSSSVVGSALMVILASSLAWAQMPAGPPGPPPPIPGGGPPPPAGAPIAAGGIGGGMYNQVTSSHCRYLVEAPSPWGTNASPFKLYTRSHSGEIRRGYPVEVSILPFYEAFKYFNFTDFALWAEPHLVVNPRPMPVEPEKRFPVAPAAVSPGPNAVTHLGVWQVFGKYAGGATSLKCNMYTRGEDTVGSFEERMLELLKAQFPFDTRLFGFHPSARHGAAFLWYPDERTMGTAVSIKFVAKLKSFGQWFKLESSPWRVNRPPPPRRYTPGYHNEIRDIGTFVDTYQNMRSQLRHMENRLDRAGVPGI